MTHHDPELGTLIDALVELRDTHRPLFELMLKRIKSSLALGKAQRTYEQVGAEIERKLAEADCG
jgi:hypothetical protein